MLSTTCCNGTLENNHACEEERPLLWVRVRVLNNVLVMAVVVFSSVCVHLCLYMCSLVFVHVIQRTRTSPCTNRHTRAQLTITDTRGGQSMATRMANI